MTPMAKRATDDEEAEVLRWAANGITRVCHVLDLHTPGRAAEGSGPPASRDG